MVINIAVIVGSILISVIVALALALHIGKPMKACVNRMKLLVEGDLDTPMPKTANKDETGVLRLWLKVCVSSFVISVICSTRWQIKIWMFIQNMKTYM